MARVGLIGQPDTTRSTSASAQTCVNLYAEISDDPNEKAQGIGSLFGAPGRHLFKDLTTIDAAATPIRGVWSGGGRLFAAAGTKYMELSSAGALIGSVRTIADDASHSPVQFFANGNQLFIVSAGNCYVDNGAGPTIISLPSITGSVATANTSVLLLAGDLFEYAMAGGSITINAVVYTVLLVSSPTSLVLTTSAGIQTGVTYSASLAMSAITGAFLDNYFIVNRTNTKQFNISPLGDGSNGGTYVWDPLDFAIKESYPDNIRAVLAANEQLYLFGTETGEVWQNTGAANFPFQRIDGATFNVGTVSSWSPIELAGRVYFLGTNREGQITAYVMNGFTPVRISSYAQEAQWQAIGAPTSAYSYGYTEGGHTFWVFHVGTQCWAYDISGPESLRWHQRNAWSGAAFTVYPTYYHTFIAEFATAAGQHITGGPLDGKLYVSSVDFYDDAGSDITWERTLPYVYNGGDRMYFKRNTLQMQTGTVPSGAAPNVTRTYSDNDGNTFGNSQTASIGVHDDFTIRVFWPVGGSSRKRLWRYRGTGQYKVALTDMHMDVVQGTD